MRQYFTSEQYLRDNLPISRNLDSKDLMPNVQIAEEMIIQNILGSEFYEYLYDKFTGQTLNANEVILVQDYIKPPQAYRALALALPFLYSSIKNKGPQTQSEDFSNSVDLTSLKFLINETKNRAEFYENRLQMYLCKNSGLFPQYTQNNDGVILPDKEQGFDSGLIFY